MSAHAVPVSHTADKHRYDVVPLPAWWSTYPVMALGALACCFAFAMSRSNVRGATPLYWAGQAALLLPCIVACLRRTAAPHSRLWALQLLAALQALLAWAYSPDRFRFPDELQHLRTAHDIIASGHLFTANPALPVSPGFPSLEIVTTAVSQVGGISVFAAGILTASLAHVLLVTAVYAWAGALQLGSRPAAVCALIYGFAPDYPYFDVLFTYTAIALPFFVLTARMAVASVTRRDAMLLALPPLLIAVVSHHLTGYLTCGYVALLAITVLRSSRRNLAPRLAGIAVLGLAAAAAWTAAFAPHAFDYLFTPTRVALHSLINPHAGAAHVAAQGIAAPLWQRVLTIVGSAVMTVAALTGAVVLWRSHSVRWLRWLGLGALAYPAVLVIRVVAAAGPEIGARLLAYAMLLACLPVAIALVSLWADGGSRRRVAGAFAAVVLIGAGSTVAATPQSWERLPGTFHVASYESGVDSRVAAAASYAGRAFPAGSIVACDLSLCSLVGGQTPTITSAAAAPMFYDTSPLRHSEITKLGLDYVLVDDRMTRQRPAGGNYFPGEAGNRAYPRPYPASLLADFATDPAFSRIYDNGSIQVYDVSAVWNG